MQQGLCTRLQQHLGAAAGTPRTVGDGLSALWDDLPRQRGCPVPNAFLSGLRWFG
jgi:hypothetical protein